MLTTAGVKFPKRATSQRPPTTRAHPLVHVLFSVILARNMQLKDIVKKSGVGANTIIRMKKGGYEIRFHDIEAIANAIGLSFALVPTPGKESLLCLAPKSPATASASTENV